MPELSLIRKRYTYVDDTNTPWGVTANDAEASQVVTGGVLDAPRHSDLPPNYTPRYGVFRTSGLAANVSRRVRMYTLAAYNGLAVTNTINLNHLGNSVVFTYTGRKRAERIRDREVTLTNV